jgi:RNA polymerase sigma-70 factor, ECF subfamily
MGSPGAILATRTTTQLLDALLEASNEPVWIEFDARYRPVLIGVARRLGLSEADAEEAAQQSLSEFVKGYREGRYDRNKGRLSSWLLGIAHNVTMQMFRGGRARRQGGDTVIAEMADEPSLWTIWADERDRAVLAQALERMRADSSMDDRTLLAFELAGLRGVPVAEAAAQARMTAEQVYVAKSRVTKRLRAIVEELTAVFEEDA